MEEPYSIVDAEEVVTFLSAYVGLQERYSRTDWEQNYVQSDE